jgi:hypothetical protein
MKARLRAISSLSTRERLQFAQAWFLLLFIDLSLRVFSFRKVYNGLSGAHHSRKLANEEQIDAAIRGYSAAVARAARHHLYPMTCLRRSLVLKWLLSRRGIQTELRIGVRREAENLDAHAWLEYRDTPIGETTLPEVQYQQLKSDRATR